MNIKDLKAGLKGISVEEAELVEKGPTREFVTAQGRRLHVSNSVIRDATGSVPISIWDADIEKVQVGDKVSVTNVIVKDFRGSPSISMVRGSTIKVLP